MIDNTQEFVEMLARVRTASLAQLTRGQPGEFWEELAARLDASPDGTITEEDVMEALHEEELNE